MWRYAEIYELQRRLFSKHWNRSTCWGCWRCSKTLESRSMLVYSNTIIAFLWWFTLAYQETLSMCLVYAWKFSWCLDSRAWRIVITFVVIFGNVTVKCRGYGWLKERQGWLFREVAVIFLSTSLLFFIKIMCTTSKRDVGLARSLKYLSLKGYKILMEVWCSDGEGFFFFFFFLKNTYNHTSHMFRFNWSIPARQFCWTFYLCNRGLAFNLNWLCRKAKGSLRVLIPACSQVIGSFCSCIFVFSCFYFFHVHVQGFRWILPLYYNFG